MVRLLELADRYDTDLAGLWGWSSARLQAELGWSDHLLLSINAYRGLVGTCPACDPPDQVLLPMDRQWPAGFKDLRRPPLRMFWRGNASLLNALGSGQAVAVVGSRRPSMHGLKAAELLGEALARAGWPVVSGLAEGIDAAAHRGCLQAGGQPVAVLGTPLERVYPPEHHQLQTDVAEAGLLFTELAPESKVQRSSFALRNRLLVALARAVVVVECPQNSGALITARAALEQGRALWSMPADVLRPSSQGSNRLFLEGARPLLDPDQLLQTLGQAPLAELPSSAASRHPSGRSLVEARRRLLQRDPMLKAMLEEGATLQCLANRLARSPVDLAEQLVALELEGVLKAEPGMRWRLA